MPCSLVGISRRFRGPFVYPVSHARIQQSLESVLLEYLSDGANGQTLEEQVIGRF